MHSVSQSLFCQTWAGCAKLFQQPSHSGTYFSTWGMVQWHFHMHRQGCPLWFEGGEIPNTALEGSWVFSCALCRTRQALKPSCLSWNSRDWLHNQQLTLHLWWCMLENFELFCIPVCTEGFDSKFVYIIPLVCWYICVYIYMYIYVRVYVCVYIYTYKSINAGVFTFSSSQGKGRVVSLL